MRLKANDIGKIEIVGPFQYIIQNHWKSWLIRWLFLLMLGNDCRELRIAKVCILGIIMVLYTIQDINIAKRCIKMRLVRCRKRWIWNYCNGTLRYTWILFDRFCHRCIACLLMLHSYIRFKYQRSVITYFTYLLHTAIPPHTFRSLRICDIFLDNYGKKT